jgi:alanine racemase
MISRALLQRKNNDLSPRFCLSKSPHARLIHMMSRATAVINLAHYQRNIQAIRAHIPPHTQIMAVVKANAYGLGGVPIARAAIEAGASWLAVAQVKEGVELREAGITGIPILLLSEPHNEPLESLWGYAITPTVYQAETIAQLNILAINRNQTLNVHLKIDTHMSRLGCQPEDAKVLIEQIQSARGLRLEGVFTHFASADEPGSDMTEAQFQLFKSIIDTVHHDESVLLHSANSGAIHHFISSHLDLVRVGIGSYRDILTLDTTVLLTKRIRAGTPVGYGGEFRAESDTTIVTLPIGYADGIPRHYGLSGGEVLIQGQRFPIIGRVCMDMLMVDIGDADIAQGERATIIGTQGSQTIPLNEFAVRANCSEYEVLCRLGPRIHRDYKFSTENVTKSV